MDQTLTLFGNYERRLVIAFCLFLSLFGARPAFAVQVYRIDPAPVMTTSGNVPIGGFPALYAVANATIQLCSDAACATPATAYTDSTGATACPINAPVTLPGTTVCVSTTGPQGQFGFWIQPGTFYFKITTPAGQSFGPFPISSPNAFTVSPAGIISSNTAGALAPMTDVLDCSRFAGASPTIQIAACATALPATGGTTDARNFPGAQNWTSDAFSGIGKPVDFPCEGTTFTVSANSTIPANVHNLWGQGCIFSINGGVTLTINGSMDGSSRSQHFSGAGTVSFGSNNLVNDYPGEWWGMVGDNATNNSTALTNAIASIPSTGGKISVGPGQFLFTSQVSFNKANVWLTGASENVSTMVCQASSGITMFKIANVNNVHFQHFGIQNNGTTACAVGIYSDGIGTFVDHVNAINVTKGFTTAVIQFGADSDNGIDNHVTYSKFYPASPNTSPNARDIYYGNCSFCGEEHVYHQEATSAIEVGTLLSQSTVTVIEPYCVYGTGNVTSGVCALITQSDKFNWIGGDAVENNANNRVIKFNGIVMGGLISGNNINGNGVMNYAYEIADTRVKGGLTIENNVGERLNTALIKCVTGAQVSLGPNVAGSGAAIIDNTACIGSNTQGQPVVWASASANGTTVFVNLSSNGYSVIGTSASGSGTALPLEIQPAGVNVAVFGGYANGVLFNVDNANSIVGVQGALFGGLGSSDVTDYGTAQGRVVGIGGVTAANAITNSSMLRLVANGGAGGGAFIGSDASGTGRGQPIIVVMCTAAACAAGLGNGSQIAQLGLRDTSGGGLLVASSGTVPETGGISASSNYYFPNAATPLNNVVTGNLSATTVGNGATSYFSIGAALNATEASIQTPCPRGATIRNFFIKTSTSQDGGGSAVITMRKAGAGQAVTVTIGAGATANTFSDTTHSFTCNAGDLIDVQVVNNSGAGVTAAFNGYGWTYDLK